MGDTKRFGEEYRRRLQGEIPAVVCEVCGEEMEVDTEGGDAHCPVCEAAEE